ncbi:PspC domain-containing protein [Candidatus Poriferisodalis sp.]|uniref:PspC domain-containing protein n=1 Tax=Candidatus Poriferisodalis sp. TaxID=3101277 RepID=UPI003B022C93
MADDEHADVPTSENAGPSLSNDADRPHDASDDAPDSAQRAEGSHDESSDVAGADTEPADDAPADNEPADKTAAQGDSRPEADGSVDAGAGVSERSEPRLRRSDDNRVLGGVAGGLAERLGLAPAAVRIGWVAAAAALLLFVGFGAGLGGGEVVAYVFGWLVLYAIAWLALPSPDGPSILAARLSGLSTRRPSGEAPKHPSGRTSSDRGRPRWRVAVAVVLIGLGIVVVVQRGEDLFDGLADGLDRGPLGFPVVGLLLLALGAALVLWPYRRTRSATAPTTSPDPADAGRTPAAAARPLRADRVRRRRGASAVGAVSLALLVVYAGVIAVLHSTGALDAHIAPTLAGALGIVGIGLVASAFTVPARTLLAVGALLASGLLLTAGSRASWGSGFGEDHVFVSGFGADETEIRHGIGNLTVDFTAFMQRSGVHDYEIDLAVGELIVLVPDRLHSMLDINVGTGWVMLSHLRDGRLRLTRNIGDTGGIGVSRELGFPAHPDAEARVQLDIDVGVGTVEIISIPDNQAQWRHERIGALDR